MTDRSARSPAGRRSSRRCSPRLRYSSVAGGCSLHGGAERAAIPRTRSAQTRGRPSPSSCSPPMAPRGPRRSSRRLCSVRLRSSGRSSGTLPRSRQPGHSRRRHLSQARPSSRSRNRRRCLRPATGSRPRPRVRSAPVSRRPPDPRPQSRRRRPGPANARATPPAPDRGCAPRSACATGMRRIATVLGVMATRAGRAPLRAWPSVAPSLGMPGRHLHRLDR